MKKVVVISLGGSLIVPDEVDYVFLQNLRKVLGKHKKKYKFVIVCGGGSIARKYIAPLHRLGKSDYLQSMAGIGSTRMNARFMTYFFDGDASQGIPHDMKQVKNLLRKNDIVFCGALRYAREETSDGTAAKLARFFKTNFINLTNVDGLYSANPFKNKKAKFISKISWKELNERARKLKYKPGQHFVIDQHAAKVIMKSKIKTYILGKNLKNLDNLFLGKKFKGTTVSE